MFKKFCAIAFVVLVFALVSMPSPAASQGAKPDLKIAQISAVQVFKEGVPIWVELKVEILNASGQPVQTPFPVSLSYRTGPEQPWIKIKDWTCPSLGANSAVTFSVETDLEKAASHTFRAAVDADNLIPESNKRNNVLEITKIFAPAGQAGQVHPAGEETVYAGNLEVLVTAPRLEIPLRDNPAATTVVETPILRTMPKTIAADEALKLVPGVKVDNQADGERVHVSIRGQGILTERGIRGIKVLLDGLPLNDPTGFAPDFFDVDWATVDRVEVFRGAAASLYGGGASGGIINIETRDGGQRPIGGDGYFLTGTYGFAKALADVDGTTGAMNYRFAGSLNRGDGYRVHTRYSSDNAYGKFNFAVSPSLSLTAVTAYTDFFNQNAEGLNIVWLNQDRRMANPDALIYNEYQETKRLTTGLVGRLALADNQDMVFSTYFRRTGYTDSVPSSVQHRTLYTPGISVQYNLHTGLAWAKNHLSLGADLEWQSIDEYRRPNLGGAIEGPELLSDETISQSGRGFYLIDRLDFGPQWGLILSLRHDHINNDLDDHLETGGVDLSGQASFDKTTGRVGLTWNPLSNFGLYTSWGSGFLPPATEELANNPDYLGGFNSHLVPATSGGEEIGARGFVGDVLYCDVALFHLRTDNDFGRYRIPGRPLETFYRNVGSSRRYGLEAFLDWTPHRRLGIKLAYTYSDFKYISYEIEDETLSGTRLPNSPAHYAYLDVETHLRRNVTAGVGIRMQSRSYIDATNLTWIDGFALVNVRLIYGFEAWRNRLELHLAGRNIFSAKYIAFTEPDPDGNSYQPGPTAEFVVGLRVYLGRTRSY